MKKLISVLLALSMLIVLLICGIRIHKKCTNVATDIL